MDRVSKGDPRSTRKVRKLFEVVQKPRTPRDTASTPTRPLLSPHTEGPRRTETGYQVVETREPDVTSTLTD